MQIFSGSTGYAGFYGPKATGNNVTVTISRAGKTGGEGKKDSKGKKDTTKNLTNPNEGFLADSYQIQWGRTVQIKRVFNVSKPIAIVGFGQGTVTLRGLIGTAAGFKNIVGGNSTENNADLCSPLVIRISGTGAFNPCPTLDDKTPEIKSNTQGGATFNLNGCVLAQIAITGSIETASGTVMQQADVTFNIGGFELEEKK